MKLTGSCKIKDQMLVRISVIAVRSIMISISKNFSKWPSSLFLPLFHFKLFFHFSMVQYTLLGVYHLSRYYAGSNALPSTTPQLVFYCLSTLGVNDGGHLSKVFLCYSLATVEHCFFLCPSCCTIPFDLDAFRSFCSISRERSGKKANASFFQPDEQWQRPPIVTPFLVASWNTRSAAYYFCGARQKL